LSDQIQARLLAFNYSEAEDRIVIVVTGQGHEKHALFLTRRFTDRLLNALASLLKQSSPAAAQAPVELQDDMVLLEHQNAVVATNQGENRPLPPGPGARTSAAAKEKIRTGLVTNINVSTKPRHFDLTISSGEAITVDCRLSRKELHWVVGMLSSKAEEANWNIRLDASWLETGQTAVTLN